MNEVLVVEDDPRIRASLLFQLREGGFEPEAFGCAEDAIAHLEATQRDPALLLLDVRLPGMSGVELARRLVAQDRLPATIIISGEASISETVEALKLGVHDFIEKPFSKERLLQSIRNTLAHTSLRREVAELRSELSDEAVLLGSSPGMHRLRSLIERAAPSDGRVLIRGESGTGKELVADAIMRQSDRRQRPFIKVNCAALPEQLIEGELFGYVKGAFTDAHRDKPGLFEAADGGTLFLDEIGDMPHSLQSRLLRVLEDGKVRRIGDTKDRQIDVRVIAATHADLELAIEEKRFRGDLFFRLAHLPVEIPPLRERGDDIQLLFEHFLRRSLRRSGSGPRSIEAGVMELLGRYQWPGNVRELMNVCERLAVFGGDPVTVAQLPASIRRGAAPEPAHALLRPEASRSQLPLKEFKRRCEKEYLERILDSTGWNVSAAARLLGIQRSYLHHRLGVLGSHRPTPDDQVD